MIWTLIQAFFIIINIVILAFYSIIVLTMRRAAKGSELPILPLWKFIVFLNGALVIGSIVFILLT